MITGAGSTDTDLDARFAEGRRETRWGRPADGRARAADVPKGIRWGPTRDDLRFRPASVLSFSFPFDLLLVSYGTNRGSVLQFEILDKYNTPCYG